jgi:tol-pal system protein YbgF
MRLNTKLLALPLFTLAFSTPVFADKLEQRISRMERVLESQSLLEMVERLDALQMEVQQLRGQLEEQQHLIDGMKSRQRELYLDVDRRMTRLEREGGAPAAAPQIPLTGTPSTPLTSAPTPTSNTTPPVTAPQGKPASAAPADPQKLEAERKAYQKAFELLRELRYEQATTAFRDFLKQYPDGRHAHIAQYWLGEAAYARRDFEQAINDYQGLLDNYPRSGKRAEAMLKIGYSYQELKKPAEAKKMMERLLELYPNSTEAGQARNQLRRLKKSGG